LEGKEIRDANAYNIFVALDIFNYHIFDNIFQMTTATNIADRKKTTHSKVSKSSFTLVSSDDNQTNNNLKVY